MIRWYEDNSLGIYFSNTPDVGFNYPENRNDKCKKPFVLKNEIEVTLWDFNKFKVYEFVIPKEYCWDGATIPRIFWRLIGAKTDPRFLIASLIHDVLCENHDYVNCDRYFADKVFERLLFKAGVNAFTRWMMFHSVDNFQKFCGWRKK